MKIRLNSYKSDNEKFLAILKKLQEINLIQLVNVSKSYPNRGQTIYERMYIDLEINPEFNNPKYEGIKELKNPMEAGNE